MEQEYREESEGALEQYNDCFLCFCYCIYRNPLADPQILRFSCSNSYVALPLLPLLLVKFKTLASPGFPPLGG